MSDGRYSSSERSDGYHRGRSPRDKKTMEGTTLYVTNINPQCSPSLLKEIFEKYGPTEDCRIIQNPITRESRGFGFVSYTNADDANEAMRSLHGKEVEGRCLRVEKAKRNCPHEPTPGYYRGPPGASVKYDTRGKLKPGYLPYYEVNHSRGGHSPEDDRMHYRRRSPSRDYSPRRNSDRTHDDYYRGNGGGGNYEGYGNDRYRENYRDRSDRHHGRSRSRERHRDGYVEANRRHRRN
ncbi:putative transformer-2 protein-like protein beta [Cardiosporidium cionae]|uniref:Transformer-2 protein-like protein beta n=1 Tax=Cardiosporidium cionae TaxID=476202 RepID=A0ABQ7J8N8_9APIC|nr:putative transformer-2 protein-like protein beta [Cardiosporidium cionae]|eukprot:KAF8820336.1 putative transformer-2 protein-like protein beta [Cardiosporidium cionae]